jgi:transposase-like protein
MKKKYPLGNLPARRQFRRSDRVLITNEFRIAAVELAKRTSQKNAARVFGVSFTAVRKWMLQLGVKPRGIGAPTLKEKDNPDYRSPELWPRFEDSTTQ